MKKVYYYLSLFIFLVTISCGGGSSSSGGGGFNWPSGDYQYLNAHNAGINNGIIIRWETPIFVNTNGIPGAEDSFRQWGLPFSFVNADPPEGIVVRIGNLPAGTCGVTESRWFLSNGRMISATITIRADLRGCNNTITHEAGHALGIHVHTADGGLMDLTGGNGQITSPVRNMINLLYAFPVGTDITPQLSGMNPSLLKKFAYKKIPDGGIVRWVDR